MIVFFANVGNRDVQTKSGQINRCRIIGKDYFERFEEEKDRLRFPIIEKGIEYVLSNEKQVNNVILFYTDQERDNVENIHFEADTIYFAKLLKKMILEKFQKVQHVTLAKIEGVPVKPEDLFPFYEQYYKNYSDENEIDTVIISPAGGIPACNWAMMFQATRVFRDKTVVVYVSDSGDVTEIPTSKIILDEYNREVCNSFLDEYNFTGAIKVMESRQFCDSDALYLAKYAEARLRFDFSSAIINLEKFGKRDELIETLSGSISKFTQDIKQANSNSSDEEWEEWLDLQKQKIAELAMNSEVKWFQGEYADFLGRIFRFKEATQRFIFERETHHSSEKKKGKFPDFEKYLKNDEYFRRKLEKKKNLRCEPTGLVMEIYLKKLKEMKSELSKTIDVIENLENLADLRNKSIIAHGYRPITREEIETYYNGNILSDLDEVVKYFNEEDRKISIDNLVTIIKKEIQ